MALSCASISLATTACVSQSRLGSAGNSAQPAPAVLPVLPGLARLASDYGEFQPFRDGADFAADLAHNRCAGADTSAFFTPDYAPPNLSLTAAAYCLYRLELDPAAASATLTAVWNGAAPQSAACWVGLANWDSGAWDWQPLSGDALAISHPAAYADAAKHCFCALVVLGATPGELVSISFGPLPPPDTGYTLFAPMASSTTYLINDSGTVVHTWPGVYTPGASAILAADGYLWRQLKIENAEFAFGGQGGRLEKVDWAGNVVWSYELSTNAQCSHHDFALLPNGNVLLIAWNRFTPAQVLALGRDPDTVPAAGLLIDSIIEIAPTPSGADIVWQWNTIDHIVQDFDNTKPFYGDPAAHPELIDFNYFAYPSEDWTHINSVDYNPELDQIVVSPLIHCEVWVIDHSTTTQQAAGHTGGRYGHGGDLLYRWGNQCAYGAGTPLDRKLYGQHNVRWIPPGLEGAGDLMVFNNMAGTLDGQAYSTVVEITPPLNPDGSYDRSGSAFGPDKPVWRYIGTPPGKLFGVNMSSAQRLPNGNTLICNGPDGRVFEATPGGHTVWEYQIQYPSPGSTVFRVLRYPRDYPGLAGLQP